MKRSALKVFRDDGFWYPCTSVQIVCQFVIVAAVLSTGHSFAYPLVPAMMFVITLIADYQILKFHRQRLIDRMKWRLLAAKKIR